MLNDNGRFDTEGKYHDPAFRDAARKLVLNGSVPSKALAEMLGYKKANRLTDACLPSTNKLTARFCGEWIVPLTNKTGSKVLVEYILEQVGLIGVDKTTFKVSKEDNVQMELLAVTEVVGKVAHEVKKAVDPSGPKGRQFSKEELKTISKLTHKLSCASVTLGTIVDNMLKES